MPTTCTCLASNRPSTPLKVLIPNHFPLQGSGSGIYSLNVARELTKLGHEVMAIVPEHGPVTGYPFPVKSIVFSNGENQPTDLDFNFPCFTTHPVSTTTFYELTDQQLDAYLAAWRKAMLEAVNAFQPDVVHVQHVWLTAFVTHEVGLPYVASCHGTDLMGFKKGPRYRDQTLIGARHAHRIIAISRQVREDARATYQVSEDKLALIWNGFDSDCFKVIASATRETVLSELELEPSEGPLVSFVGKFADFKGIDVLLKAAALYEPALPGVRTVLVGHGELLHEMSALRDELDLKAVHFVGHKPQPEVARIYNAADVSVVPSRVEPFGLVAVEALACGTPVVATNAGGLPDFITDEVGTLVPVDDAEALANAIVAEVRNEKRADKSSFASQYALEGFTWTEQVGKMQRLYESALSG